MAEYIDRSKIKYDRDAITGTIQAYKCQIDDIPKIEIDDFVKMHSLNINKIEKLRAEIDKAIEQMIEEKEFAYADFDEYKREVLEVDDIDDIPNDDFRYGMERCIEILKKNVERQVMADN